MADFCKACSIDMFGKDFREMAGLCGPDEVAQVLCEGCGHVLVNSDGECLSTTCAQAGEPGHGVAHAMFVDAAGNRTEPPPLGQPEPFTGEFVKLGEIETKVTEGTVDCAPWDGEDL